MKLYDENYELATGVEIDELLSELPLDLMRENLKSQIDNPLSTTTNYLNIISEKYEILKDNFSEDDFSMQKLKTAITEVFSYVLKTLNARLELGIDLNEESTDIFALTENIYTYFILDYRRNIYKFFYKFIKANKKMLVDHYEKHGKKKDVTTLNLKKQFKNKDDVIILSNLPSIVNFIKTLYIEAEDFVEYTSIDDSYEGKFVKDLITSNILNGDFVDTYLNIVFDENDVVLDEIQIGLKVKLIKKFTD